jgi:hypothetical protein
VPLEAFGLALAAAFYPPAVVAMIAVTRGDRVRRRLLAYLLGAATMTFGAGAVMLILLKDGGVNQRDHPAPGAALEIALGVVSLALAAWLWRRRLSDDLAGSRPATGAGPSRTERLTRRLELIFVLGFLMYAPSPLYFGAVKAVVDSDLSDAADAALVAVLGAIVLLMVEVPALLVVVAPERATAFLEGSNSWLRRNARTLGAAALGAGGAYLLARGIVHAAR